MHGGGKISAFNGIDSFTFDLGESATGGLFVEGTRSYLRITFSGYDTEKEQVTANERVAFWELTGTIEEPLAYKEVFSAETGNEYGWGYGVDKRACAGKAIFQIENNQFIVFLNSKTGQWLVQKAIDIKLEGVE